jgi:hypothetical protein
MDQTDLPRDDELPPGIHPGVPFADYQAMRGINQSTLKHFSRSAAHVRHSLDDRRPGTPAQLLGTAMHCALLEPDRFRRDYFLPPKADRRTKVGKAVWAKAVEENPHATAMDKDDYFTCLGMVKSARGNARGTMRASGALAQNDPPVHSRRVRAPYRHPAYGAMPASQASLFGPR